MPSRARLALGASIAVGGAVRLATLDLQSFGHDEAVTALHVLQPGILDTLVAVSERERNGPLYYVLAWLWTRVLGEGEIGLRSLSAVFGTLTIWVAYLTATEVASERAGAVAAALVALNPFLFWYSQEARPYALVVLLIALSLLFLARALRRPSRRWVVLWALASAGALATQYFAAFFVVPAAVWLVLGRRRRDSVVAVAGTAAVGAALLPLALAQAQSRTGELYAATSLVNRVLEAAVKFSAGNELSLFPELRGIHVVAAAISVVAGVLWLGGLAISARGGRAPADRSRLLPSALGALAVGVPVAISIAGVDLVNPRNLIVAAVPLAVGAAIGFAVSGLRRVGLAAAGLLGAAFAANLVLVLASPALQRPDFRLVAETVEPVDDSRLVIAPRLGVPQLSLYTGLDEIGLGRRQLRAGQERAVPAGEIDVVMPRGRQFAQGLGDEPAPPAPGFEHTGTEQAGDFHVHRFQAERPRPVDLTRLSESRVVGKRFAPLGDRSRLAEG